MILQVTEASLDTFPAVPPEPSQDSDPCVCQPKHEGRRTAYIRGVLFFPLGDLQV
jgi:hypothetical protein